MNSILKLDKETKIWLRRNGGINEILCIIPDADVNGYIIYPAYEERLFHLGRILFDDTGYWIYDGDVLTIAEQEQVARFIINYVEAI